MGGTETASNKISIWLTGYKGPFFTQLLCQMPPFFAQEHFPTAPRLFSRLQWLVEFELQRTETANLCSDTRMEMNLMENETFTIVDNRTGKSYTTSLVEGNVRDGIHAG